MAAGALSRPKKKAEEEERTIAFVDESAFYQLPMAVRSYAKQGQTPVLKVPLSRDHFSVIGAITPQGRIFMQMQDHSYKGPDVVRFLQLLLREIPGKILLLWDGASIHRSQCVKDFLTKGGAKRLHLERLPAYAPELNPQEGVWNLLKRRELKNVCCLTMQDLARHILLAKERLRHRKQTLSQCFARYVFWWLNHLPPKVLGAVGLILTLVGTLLTLIQPISEVLAALSQPK